MTTTADRARQLNRERQQRFRLRHKAPPSDLFCGVCLARFTPARKGQRTCSRNCSYAAQGYRKRVKQHHRSDDDRRFNQILAELAQTHRLDALVASGKATRADVDAYLQQQEHQRAMAERTIAEHRERDRQQHGDIAETYATAAHYYCRPVEGRDEVSGADLLASNVRYGVFAADLLGLTPEQSEHFWAALQRWGAAAEELGAPAGAMRRHRIRDAAYDAMVEERIAAARERISARGSASHSAG